MNARESEKEGELESEGDLLVVSDGPMDDQWRTETEIVRSCRSVAESVKRR